MLRALGRRSRNAQGSKFQVEIQLISATSLQALLRRKDKGVVCQVGKKKTTLATSGSAPIAVDASGESMEAVWEKSERSSLVFRATFYKTAGAGHETKTFQLSLLSSVRTQHGVL
jgi:hypothetical protein